MLSKVEDFPKTLFVKKITPAAVAKDLGVILDPCLTCTDHSFNSVQLHGAARAH